jgi:hypothetical protein
MTIQPLSNPQREAGVTEAVEPALERVKQMLFRPFDFTKWIVIGFCAWLAGLGESGGGLGGFNSFNNQNSGSGRPAEQFRQFLHQARDFVLANLDWIVPLAAFLFLLALAVGVLVLWLNCRGKFMFLHCVARDAAEVEVPWRRYAAQANSLFWFRLVLGLIGMVLCLPLLIFLILAILELIKQGEPDVAAVLGVAGFLVGLLLAGILLTLIRKFLVDFVVPIMYLRGGSCLAAWSEFGRLLSANPGRFTIYILFQIVLSIVIAALILAVVLVTCCVAGCFLLLPFVGTVLLLPILIFKRSYSLYYLAQYGPEYDVFTPAADAPPAPEAAMPPPGLGPVPG